MHTLPYTHIYCGGNIELQELITSDHVNIVQNNYQRLLLSNVFNCEAFSFIKQTGRHNVTEGSI